MQENNLKRGLKSRHVSMIAIGGSIGTGIFVASGNAIFTGGPGGAILAYLVIALMVYFLMTSLGEMSALLPVTGTFCDYSTRFVEPAFGFAMSYNYWFNWAITIAVELSAASFIMGYWFPHVPFVLWSLSFFALVFLVNVVAVGVYGEAEYCLSILKVVTIIAFIIVGFLMVMGVVGHHAINFHNWVIGDAPFHQGYKGLMSVFLVAGFAFQGTELFGVTAGEAVDPGKTIPKAMVSVFWRILLFYILSMFVISLVVPYTDQSLMNASTQNIALSPFTVVFAKVGLKFAASLMNLVILTAVLSACSASMYTATRMLWHIAKVGQGPKIFAKVSRHHVPIYALLASAAFGSLVFLSSIFGNGKVFIWLVNVSSMIGFIAWLGIAISHYRFRRAYIAQGKDLSILPYRSKYFPFAPIFALMLCAFVIISQQYTLLIDHSFNWGDFIGTYIGVPVFVIPYLAYKYIKKSRLIPLKDCNFDHEK